MPACSFTEEALWPSLTGEDPSGEAQQQADGQGEAAAGQEGQAQAEQMATAPGQPPLGNTNFQPSGVTEGEPTGTVVGKKVQKLRQELKQLQSSIAQHNTELQKLRAKTVEDSQRYHGAIAAISARLQVGTTPGNPILVQQFNGAQSDLDRIAQDVSEMNKLATAVSSDSTMSAYLAERAQATYNISGAVDEDHRQLAILEDEVNRTVVLIDRLLKEVTEDVRRQTNYVGTERSNLNTLAAAIKEGELLGDSMPNRVRQTTAQVEAGKPMDVAGRRALVVIRFDRANVPYEQALYNAVSKVLERRPDATFDLVAVAPTRGGKAREALNSTKARRHAEQVLRSLMEMGLPPDRVALSGTSMSEARTNQVRLYLR